MRPRRLGSPVAERFLGAAIQSHATLDCWRGNGINLSMLSRARHENSPRPCAIKNLRKGSQEPKCRTFRPTRNARAELTGAAGSHTSSTPRIRHYWLADIDLAPAFVRLNHAVSWTAGDDSGRLHGPRAHPRGHGSAVDCGPRRTGFPAFHHDATLAN
jgi:hypothetical protein